MVKKCIVVNNGTTFPQIIACFIKLMNVATVVCVGRNIGDILCEMESEESCIIVFSAISFCSNIEYICGEIYKKQKNTKIICFCNRVCSRMFGLRLYKNGINCIINSSTNPFELTRILADAFNGQSYYPTELKEAIENREYLFMDGKSKKLTPREIEIMFNLSQGYSHKYIAKYLVITETTVSTTVNRVLKKLGVESKEQAIKVLVEEGVLAEWLQEENYVCAI